MVTSRPHPQQVRQQDDAVLIGPPLYSRSTNNLAANFEKFALEAIGLPAQPEPKSVVPPTGLEPMSVGLEIRCSI